jgi:hypothetical protein
MRLNLFTLLALPILVIGCASPDLPTAPQNAAHQSPILLPPASDKWLGRWIGPEGTFLQLDGGQGNYQVTIQDLDGPRTFQGNSVESGIEFQRDGVKEVIRATNGNETEMKWLDGKLNCLTVHPGEGYCKD